VHSEIGEGTTVTMRIPLRKQFRVGRESPRVIVSDFRELEHDATTLPPFHYLTKICSHVDPDLRDTEITTCNTCNRHSRIGSWECLHEGSISSVWKTMFNRQALPTFDTNVNFGFEGWEEEVCERVCLNGAVQLENVAKK
jgi:hypothetical protein